MDKLISSDINATIKLILKCFTERIRKKVEEKVKEKYGFGLNDERIIKLYPRPFERNPKKFTHMDLKTLADLINNDTTLYISKADPCKTVHIIIDSMQVSYKLSAIVAFYYGVKKEQSYRLRDGIEYCFVVNEQGAQHWYWDS